jgi:hypothetical protein
MLGVECQRLVLLGKPPGSSLSDEERGHLQTAADLIRQVRERLEAAKADRRLVAWP